MSAFFSLHFHEEKILDVKKNLKAEFALRKPKFPNFFVGK
jgi:hypothetical protein